jgi:excisionase family DNA binding protein
MNFVRKIRGLRLGHDGSLEKLAVPLWPDAGKALGLSRNHTYDAARAGEIPTVKFGRTIRVPLAALRKMLEDAGQKPGPNKK